MTPDQVIELMESSQTEAEWNSNCDKVKAGIITQGQGNISDLQTDEPLPDKDHFAEPGQYPSFWYETIIMSGLAKRVAARWDGTDEIKITSY